MTDSLERAIREALLPHWPSTDWANFDAAAKAVAERVRCWEQEREALRALVPVTPRDQVERHARACLAASYERHRERHELPSVEEFGRTMQAVSRAFCSSGMSVYPLEYSAEEWRTT